MKLFAISLLVGTALFIAGCDVQSGITKKSVEKFEPTPTPAKTVEVVEQIDPAESVKADTNIDGPKINLNPSDEKTSVDCTKFNRVAINGDRKEIKIKGVCKQVMINGDENKIEAVALTEVVFNGSGNTLQFVKYTNGKKPLTQDNGGGNTVEKIDAPVK